MNAFALTPLSARPEVSVVIPLLNASRFIGFALESVLNQTYPVKEIVVVDDGSTDHPEVSLKPYVDKIRYVQTVNGGPGSARNLGVKHCSSPLIAFLDADDQWEEDKLEKQIKALLVQNAAMCYCGRTEIGAEGEFIGEFAQSEYPQGAILERLIEENHISTSSAVVMRKDVFDLLGGFKESTKLSVSEDFELWCRIAAQYKIAAVKEALVRYRLHEGNITRNNVKSYIGKIAALESLRGWLESAGLLDARRTGAIGEKISTTHLHYAWGFAQGSDYLNAKKAVANYVCSSSRALPFKLQLVRVAPVSALALLHRVKRVVSR